MARPRDNGTQSLRRATLLIRTIAAHNQEGIRLIDLAALLPIDRSTIHRIVKSLVGDGFIAQDPQSKRFFLGRSLFELGLEASHRYNPREAYLPVMQRIALETGDTVFLNSRSGNEVVCIERMQGAYPVRVLTVDVGGRRPLGTSASGIAILSAMGEDDVGGVLAEVSASKYSRKPLQMKKVLQSVAQARHRGYAVHDGEVVDVRAVGAPIRNKAGVPVAAISVSAVSTRMTDSRIRTVGELLKSGAAELEALLGQRLAG